MTQERGRILFLGLLVVALAIAFVVWAPLQYRYVDFVAMYAVDYATLRGVDVYDTIGQNAWVQTCCAGTSPLLPFGYPPWYALATTWLGAFQVDIAGRIWLLLNVAMVFGAVTLTTPRWPAPARLIASLAALFYMPVLGVLFVGQFTLPIALGAAFLAMAAKTPRYAASAGAVGLVLLSLKPHVGGLIALAALPWLVTEGRAALWRGLAAGAVVAVASFGIARGWPVDYPASALGLLHAVTCDTCSSASVALANSFTGGEYARVFAAGLFAVFLAIGVWRKPDATTRVAMAATTATVVLPYFRNYDAAILIVPLAIAWDRASTAVRGVLVAVWLAPYAILFIDDRALSVFSVWVSATVLFGVLAYSPREMPIARE